MPYINIQHPSNTRTTVTIVLSIIFGVSIIPATAFGALQYTLENADVPTLYQEVKVKIQRDPQGKDPQIPKIEAGDKVFFIESTETKDVKQPNNKYKPVTTEVQCSAAAADVTLWEVVVATDTASAVATVIIKSPVFESGKTYKVCYKKAVVASGGLAVYEAVRSVPDGNKGNKENLKTFTVLGSMFTTQDTPPTVYAGQGPVKLSITESNQVSNGRAFSVAGGKELPYLIPCPTTGGCTKEDTAPLCSSSADKDGSVTTGAVTGFGTGTLTTTFITPIKPAASYRVCVPYCFKASSCESGTISWALVNSDNLISFLPANPSVYTFKPNPPQAGTSTEITFTGTDLDQRDKIRIIPQGKVCSSEPTPLPNVEYKADVTVSSDGTSSVSSIRFNGVVIPVQVCYSRDNRNLMDDSNIWAPVFQTTGEKPKDGSKGDKPTGEKPPSDTNTDKPNGKEGDKPKDGSKGSKPTGEKPPSDTNTDKPNGKEGEKPKDGSKGDKPTGEKPPSDTNTDKPNGKEGDKPKDGSNGDKGSKPDTVPKVDVPVPPNPEVKKSSNKSATAISSTIPAVLITSVVFLYLYNW